MTPAIAKFIGERDLFLSPDLRLTARNEAAIDSRERVSALALRKFGERWGDYVEILPISVSEWLSHCGRRGGKTVTERKLRHLRRLGKTRSAQARRRKKLRQQRREEARIRQRSRAVQSKPPVQCWWWAGGLAVRAPSVGKANRYVRRVDPKIKRGDLRRSWQMGKPDSTLVERDGVFRLIDNCWVRVL